MKKLFLLFVLVSIFAIGCSENEFNNGNNGNKTEQPNENDTPENIFFGLDKESATFSPDGGSVDVVVYSNYKWEISGTSDWCTPSITKGSANEDGQKVTFSADVAYDDREATFWFRCADEKIKFVVSQKFKEVIIPDANNSFNIPAEGGIAVISYKTTVDCEVIIPEEAQDWITIAPATRGLVGESISLDIVENTTYSARTAIIKVVAKDNANLVVEYTINQEQNNALLVDKNNTFTVPPTGGKVVINYQTNVDCEVIIPEEAQDWITIVPATRGLVAYSTSLDITANNSGKQRSCVVKVVSQDYNELFVEYTITQKTKCSLYYTSSNGKIVTPNNKSSFDATILSNTYKDGVGVIEFSAPITTIGLQAFYNCKNLTSVTIPNSVTEIGSSAFQNCSSLSSVTIGDSVTMIDWYAFQDCSSLTSVTIPDSVKELGQSAFAHCRGLTNITIGDSVTKIDEYTFQNCRSLSSVTIPDSVTKIGTGAFVRCSSLQKFNGKFASEDGRCLIIESVLHSFAPAGITKYTIPASVTKIGNHAFDGCDLTNITIGKNVTTIGNNAFFGCSSLTSVAIGDSVTEIGKYAFKNCGSLSSVTIPDSVTKIDWYAFENCSSLTSVTIPVSVTEIGEAAFSGCTGELIIDNQTLVGKDYTLTNYPKHDGCWLHGNTFTKLTIGKNVTTIGNYAFYDCRSLTSVAIGDSVAKIGECAFFYCNNLTSVAIPDSVTKIGEDAFCHCNNLTSVTIPDSVRSIENMAFFDSGLKSVYCKAITPPSLGSYVFYRTGESGGSSKVKIFCKIYVPMESVSKYKSVIPWSEYAFDIVGQNF